MSTLNSMIVLFRVSDGLRWVISERWKCAGDGMDGGEDDTHPES